MKAYVCSIELLDVLPKVRRTFMTPTTISFEQFHLIVQSVMGWFNYHMYEFHFDDLKTHILDNQESIDHIVALKSNLLNDSLMFDDELTYRFSTNEKLCDYFEAGREFEYIYDFGDYWEHSIQFIKEIDDFDFEQELIILEYSGLCPPESCGGSEGYDDFLKILSNPNHYDYEYAIEFSEMNLYGEFTREDLEQDVYASIQSILHIYFIEPRLH